MAKKTPIKLFLLSALALGLLRCANQLPPSGGVVDKIPPEIINTHPADKTVNFNDDHVSFTFSEYVDKRSAKDAIFISPAIPGEKEYDWSGTTLEITFEKDSLMPNTTYSFIVGTDVKDINHGNKMAEAFTLTFSTGNKIDHGLIAGKVYDAKPQGTMIFAYRRSLGKANPLKYKPNYISQVGEDGKYKLVGLANDSYEIFAVKDKFMDLLYNVEEDAYGIPFKETLLNEKDSVINNVNFFLTREDTTAPNVLEATMTDKSHIYLQLTEPIDSSKLTANNFFFFDPFKHTFYGGLDFFYCFVDYGVSFYLDAFFFGELSCVE